MKLRSTPRNILRLLTAALFALFILCGQWGHNGARCFTAAGSGPLASSDRLFADPLDVDHGSRKILDSIADLPPRRPLALLVPSDNVYGPIFLAAIGSLTWPHRVSLIAVRNNTVEKTFDTLRGGHFAAALLFGVTQPLAAINQRQVGQLTIVPVAK